MRLHAEYDEIKLLFYAYKMLIGELSKKSGLSRDSIRFYEKLGLIEVSARERRNNNYKEYSPVVLEKLEAIKQLKQFGFTLAEIAEFLNLMDLSRPCEGLPEKLGEKIDLIEEKMSQLVALKERLELAKTICSGACFSTGNIPECLEVK